MGAILDTRHWSFGARQRTGVVREVIISCLH